MACYEKVDKNGKKKIYIKCRNPETGKTTTLRKNQYTGKPFANLKEAKEFEQKYLENKNDLNLTLREVFELYIKDLIAFHPSPAVRSYRSWYTCNIDPALGDRKVISLCSRDITNLAYALKKKPVSPGYTNKITTFVNTLVNFAVEMGYIEKNPITTVRKVKEVKTSEKIKYWTPEQFKKVILAIPERFKNTDNYLITSVLSFAYLTGLRKSEIRAMQWKQIDFKKNLIHVDYHINDSEVRVPGRKNGNSYDIYMDTNVHDLLKEIYNHYSYMEGFSKKAFVFPSLRYGFDKPLGDHTPTRWVSQLAEYTGLHNPTFHGLRHSACSYFASVCGLSPYEVADRLGDTVQVVLNTYYDFFIDQKIKTANRIDEFKENLAYLIEVNA